MKIKVPPNNIDAERSLVWAMMIDEKIINLVSLSQGDFFDASLWTIYTCLKSLKKDWVRIDLVTIADTLRNNKLLDSVWGMMALSEITESTPYIWNWKSYRNIVKEKSDRRKIISYARQIEEMGFTESQEMGEILQKVENISSYVFETQEQKKTGEVAEYIEDFCSYREKIIERKWMLWDHSPYKEIDKYTRGIIQGKVYCICAYSNVGKSKFSYTYVTHFLKQGKKVMYISLEVDKAMLFHNIYAHYSQTSFYDVVKEESYIEMRDFEKLELYDSVYGLEEIKILIQAKLPDIVFIDFIQNIQTKGSSEYEKMTRIAQELQQLAIKTWVTIFSLSQANNESRFKNWESMQPKGSGAIFASSDVIFALYRENKSMYLTLLKNKYWPANKTYQTNVNFSLGNFEFMEQLDELS